MSDTTLGAMTLLVTVLGWVVTYYYQQKILKSQSKAEKEIKNLEFSHELALSNRQLRLDILPLAWDKMIDAYSEISHLLNEMETSFPDLTSLTGAQINDWIQGLNISPSQKEELLFSKDKKAYYLEIKFWKDVAMSQNSIADFHDYLIQKKFLINDELYSEFSKTDVLFRRIMTGITTSRRDRNLPLENSYANELVLH